MSVARTAVRTTGEVLITLGVLVLLFCAYQLVWTNVTANSHGNDALNQLEEEWDRPDPSPSPSASGQLPTADAASGEGFAIMYIPSLGRTWAKAVVQGVALDDLRGTIGHYPQSQWPGAIGNFAVAGHRATNGEPFRDIPQVGVGAKVYVETEDSWYVYTVTSTEIVAPTDVDVVLPVPNKPGAEPTEALITLTTCNPRWASYERWITYGVLSETRPKSEGPPPELLVTRA